MEDSRWWRRFLELARHLQATRTLLTGTFLVLIVILAARALGPEGTGLPSYDAPAALADWAVKLLTYSMALGFAVMAMLQLVKPLLRVPFHDARVRAWVKRLKPLEDAEEFFLPKASRVERDALLDLPVEQLTAQMQANFEAKLATPGRQREALLEFGLMRFGRATNLPPEQAEKYELAGLSMFAQRELDAFQIRVRRDWRDLLRFLSIGLSVGITAFAALSVGLWKQNPIGTLFVVLLVSVLGGFFASVARDVVAIVERLRTR